MSEAREDDSQNSVDERPARDPQTRLPERPWALDAHEVLASLEVASGEGLSAEEVERRREIYGLNQLRGLEGRSAWEVLWEQVKSLIMLLLVAAMAVSFLTGQRVEAIAIAAVIVVNTAIGFFTEWWAVRSLEALQKLGEVRARVVRGGSEENVPAEDLVPGDVVVLGDGDVAAADLRLVEVAELEADESALTGESMPVAKGVESVDGETELAERSSMIWKGTAVSRGHGRGVVVATGMHTEIGEVSSMVEEAEQADTPLERKLQGLGRNLVWLTLAVAAVVTLSGVAAGRDVYLMVETGIALAVAAIPEGLPIVATVALARGMWRMLERNALIRRLSSVETLGATTLLATDKTGTLTENRMTVRRLVLAAHDAEIEVSDGRFTSEDETLEPEKSEALRAALEVAVLCDDLAPDGGEGGEPLEVALVEMGREAGFERGELLERLPEKRREDFNRQSQMMATFHALDTAAQNEDEPREKLLVAVKGAPEAVLQASTRCLGAEGEEPFGEEERRLWDERNDALAGRGYRILALARKEVDDTGAEPYEELSFLGFVALLDPPREDVKDVIEGFHQAGIRVVMVTGDHPATALNVARTLGMVDGDGRKGSDVAIRGNEFPDLESADEDELERLAAAAVIARVNPRQKLDLIDLHQARGEVVAMTGDGVNDAPALRSADIGVAMGKRGTEVAREAAEMVLQDDALSTLLMAVAQGRVIFENIRRFVVYLLSGNIGEILAVGVAAAAGWPLPLLPLQILYVNLLNDVFPALALGLGGGADRVLDKPPRDPGEPVLGRRGWLAIGAWGVLVGAGILGAFLYGLHALELGATEAATLSFLTLSLGRLFHVFNMRRVESTVWVNEITKNGFVWGAIGLCLALLAAAVWVPFLARVLSVSMPSAEGWAVVWVASLAPLVVGQIYLVAMNSWQNRTW